MTSLAVVPKSSGSDRPELLRVMVVDDSVVIRGLISRWVDAESDMTVVASLRTGLDAIHQVEHVQPDVVVLDIEMPEMDGISALPQLLARKRDLIVIMASTLTRRNAEISLKALSLGATDYVPKPETTREMGTVDTFKRDLIEKIRMLGGRARARSGRMSRPASPGAAPAVTAAPSIVPADPPVSKPRGPITLRPFGTLVPRVLLIGSSTGGPQALTTVVAGLGSLIDRVPVLITQHMPATFTTILAEHLGRASGRPAQEADDGMIVRPGQIYLARGGRHMRVAKGTGQPVIALDDGPPVNFCKPAVDVLFQSAIEVWQGAIAATILTGMGSDGMRGGAEIAKAGGSVIAQDEATSVVWGMPGAAAHAGICSAVLPLDQIAPRLNRLFGVG